MRRPQRRIGLLVCLVAGCCAVSATAALALGQQATTLASKAKAAGIKRAGPEYRFQEEEAVAEEGRLTVEFPTAWSEVAESSFRRPENDEAYGVGLRATTDVDKFHDTFDVPGMRVTVTTEVPDDPGALLEPNAPQGCEEGSPRPFDNGVYVGEYLLLERCDGKRAAAFVVVAVDASESLMLVSAGQILTKADLKAVDRALRTAFLEKPSI